MAPSSSGLGRLVLIQKIAGSTPAGVTKSLIVQTPRLESGGLVGYFFSAYGEKISLLPYADLFARSESWETSAPSASSE